MSDLRGLDRWIEGDHRGAPSNYRTRPEAPQSAGARGPTQLKVLASPYANLSPTELLARLRAVLRKDKP